MAMTISKEGVFLEGKPFRVLAGEMHYFRIHPDYWRTRLLQLKACGLNTVATYVPWNLSEPTPGVYDFTGFNDLEGFLKLARELEILVLLRPGPYICAEWEFGALPWWLLTLPGIRLRSSHPAYIKHAAAYMRKVLEVARPYFRRVDGTGCVVMVQIENGLASWSNDYAYMEILRDCVRESGFDGVICTADGDSDTRMTAPVPAGAWRMMMTGSNPSKALKVLDGLQEYPPMVGEYWTGGISWIGQQQSTCALPASKMAADVAEILDAGAHLNLYMFAGGTNFGFQNGADPAPRPQDYLACVTSYDMQSPVGEDGHYSEKYDAVRKLLAPLSPAPLPEPPECPPNAAYGRVALTRQATVLSQVERLATDRFLAARPFTMEQCGQGYGFIHYRTEVVHKEFPLPLTIVGLRDRAWVWLDGKLVADLEALTYEERHLGIEIPPQMIPEGGAALEILVENQGRINFGLHLEDNLKGITCGVVVNHQQYLTCWEMRTLPLESLEALEYAPQGTPFAEGPAFYEGTLVIDGKPRDTYLRPVNGGHGVAWVNGFNLGRYDARGPLHALYVPAPILRPGNNTIQLLELATPRLEAVDFLPEAL